ncbi:hypothetical protein BLNAU_13233 [Blattamonas nauphoetae]|uniref:Thioredoxin domain-containing protein n=1 Tax=Blattamonas nauphoetae TaxID=2049346 RepID=A0ABQ9XHE0_9EUKA|nr:hypothetical protein BLNAU_13233 [Blattamonas nauphoetae]
MIGCVVFCSIVLCHEHNFLLELPEVTSEVYISHKCKREPCILLFVNSSTPEVEETITLLRTIGTKEYEPPLSFHIANCTRYPSLCSLYRLNQTPAVQLHIQSRWFDYPNALTQQGLEQWIDYMQLPLIDWVDNMAQFFVGQDNFSCSLLFITNQDNFEGVVMYSELAMYFRPSVRCFGKLVPTGSDIFEMDLGTQTNSTFPADRKSRYILYVKEANCGIEYTGDTSLENLSEWIKKTQREAVNSPLCSSTYLRKKKDSQAKVDISGDKYDEL